MPTGRQLVHRAMRSPMQDRGWRARAAGWFTRPLGGAMTGIATVGTASEHRLPGRAGAFVQVGLRDESVEPLVSTLAGHPDGGYRQATVAVMLGYLTPEARFREREVGEEDADEVAAAMAQEVEEHGIPFLERAAHEPGFFVSAFLRHAVVAGATSVCRRAVVLANHREEAAASVFLDEQAARVAGRSGPWVDDLVPALERTRAWLSDRPGADVPPVAPGP